MSLALPAGMRTIRSLVTATLVAAVFASGCAQSEQDPCAAAAEHVAACTGEMSMAAGVCDPDQAESVLSMDCEQLTAVQSAAKADGWWDDLLCLLGFQDSCSSGGSGGSGGMSTPAPTSRTLTGQVFKGGSLDAPTTTLFIRATRTDTNETKTTYVVQGIFALTSLPVAKYRIEAALTAGSSAIASTEVDLASRAHVVLYVAVP